MRQQLIDLSADFYAAHATTFDESRRNAWQSWQQLVDQAQGLTSITDILDLGCGNGRFAAFLDTSLPHNNYTGVDTEARLIHNARERHPDKTFVVADLQHTLASCDPVDLIACFGVFHHLPGMEFRFQTLNSFARALRPRGIALISLWQPRELKNFETKVFTRHEVPGMETNDFLFGWNGDFTHLRYCHHFDNEEIHALVKQSPLHLVNELQGTANDASNHYLVLQKTN